MAPARTGNRDQARGGGATLGKSLFPQPQFPQLHNSAGRISAAQGFWEDELCDMCGKVFWKHELPDSLL